MEERKFENSSAIHTSLSLLLRLRTIKQKSQETRCGLISVTTQHFTLKLMNLAKFQLIHLCHLMYLPGSPIIINKLKYNITDENEGDELELFCKPTIGQGRHKARNNPTGTVTFQFKIDDDDKVENVFQDKLQYLNKERESKGPRSL